ncbi:MAG: ABC transporter permease [Chloroflexota bacterium]|nr:ABC transporter permease [Chloroflexota bacterium]
MTSMTSTNDQTAVPRKFMTRARWFGLFYIILGGILLYLALTAIEPDVVSKFRFGRINPDVMERLPEAAQEGLKKGVPVNSRDGLLLIAVLFILLGLPPFFMKPDRSNKAVNQVLAVAFGLMLVAALILAAMGKRTDVVGMFADGIRLATPIALGALAGLLCERAGVINIGIEGMMLTGAAMGFTASLYFQNSSMGLLVAMLSAMVMAALHAVLSIQFRVDQIISGTAINILAVGITGFTRRSFLLNNPFGAPSVFPVIKVPILSDIPVLGPIFFQHQPLVFVMLILVVVTQFYFFRTKWGLRHRSVGEHPRAADTLGIDVYRWRYVAVIAGGAIAGLGGAWFSLETVGSFDDLMTNGKGFIALAAMIFGNWNPIGAFAGALLFGFADALQIKLQILETGVPYQFIGMLPYVMTMVILAGLVGKTTPPAADGIPYEKQ